MEALYHAALEVSGEERAALLARSDPEVRHAVEILLMRFVQMASGSLPDPLTEAVVRQAHIG